MDRTLPDHPNLAQLRRQAKELRNHLQTGDPDAVGRFRAMHPHRYDERRLPAVELLLRRGASVTVRDSRFRSTPLGWAAHQGATRIFDVLRSHAGVHDAAQFGLLDRLQALLVANPACATARDALGRTPLHCVDGSTPAAMDVIALLRARGADPGARDNAGQTPYEKALIANQARLAECLRPQTAAASENEEALC